MNTSQSDFIGQCNDVINRIEQMRNALPTLIITQAHDSSALDGRLSGAIGQIESVRDKVTSLAATTAGAATPGHTSSRSTGGTTSRGAGGTMGGTAGGTMGGTVGGTAGSAADDF